MRTETAVGLFIIAALAIFFYMTLQIGAFRLDKAKYNTYTIYFYDISGLNKKSAVKIAGVTVGWVEEVELVNDAQQVGARIMVLKEYALHADAYGLIRQEGLLGSKYVEIVPGSPLAPTLKNKGILTKPSQDPVSLDELLFQFKDIAANVKDITYAFKETLGGTAGAERLAEIVGNFNEAARQVSAFSHALDNLISRNSSHVDSMLSDLRDMAASLKFQIPVVSGDIRALSEKLAHEVLPSIERGVERMSNAIDKSFNQMANNFEGATGPIQDIARKINEGRGVMGQLINDDTVSHDLKFAVQGLKNYITKIEKLSVVFDAWGESMYGLGNQFCWQDNKGYFNVRIHPTQDYFYLFGLVGSELGRVYRWETHREWFNDHCLELKPSNFDLDPHDQFDFASTKRKTRRLYDQILFNVQFGKIYSDLAFRAGIFESSFGIGIDYDIPFDTDKFRWVMSLEAFDFRGRNRINDSRPHLKWLNKVFFTRNIYMTFGADDFISHTNKNGFFGVGLRWSDDDIKYFLTKVTSFSS
jgi:phospholipid/cholesterol/gamma-HCH transport system substrate-binding protein